MDEKVQDTVLAFNQVLEEMDYPYRVDFIDPKDAHPAEKNARFMTPDVFEQLVENIKTDGGLSSLPLLWKDGEGVYHTLSGHHRIDAAVEAELTTILIMYTDEDLSKDEKIAIQLSHNSLAGQDEPTTLRNLYASIETVSLKMYSGLDEITIATIEPVKIESLGNQGLVFHDVILTFFPPEQKVFDEILERLKKNKKPKYVAPLETFDQFVETLINFKEVSGVYNTSTAMLMMLDICNEWINDNLPEDESNDH